MQDRDREDDELARRLEAYAEARLTPELLGTTRMRARVMAAAHRQAALARADADRMAAASALAAAEAMSDRTRRSAWRRPLTALLAAGLTLGIGVGTVAAAQAGGPLYGVRIWAETITLPANASERALAELQRLEDRLAEAAAASAAGDLNAANAALNAYAAIVSEATADAGNDVSAAATLENGVRSNLSVLTVLVDRAPEAAQDALQDALDRAIERSDSAVDELDTKPGGGPPDVPPGQVTVTPTPDPEHTANPNKPTPDPADTPKPHPTPKPDNTPRGGPPATPPGGGNDGAGSQAGGNAQGD